MSRRDRRKAWNLFHRIISPKSTVALQNNFWLLMSDSFREIPHECCEPRLLSGPTRDSWEYNGSFLCEGVGPAKHTLASNVL